jgi:O-succinylbenzoate synthase
MGSLEEILLQAKKRKKEGFTSAKLKVSQLSFQDAFRAIELLKEDFYLRIDVNRSWTTKDSIDFFSQFPPHTFDYVEEPFQNPYDLEKFQIHPLAIDESFPKNLSLKDLEKLPQLKAVIYKPTLQGGLIGCLDLHTWTQKRGVQLILSSTFESDLGLSHILGLYLHLSLKNPVGIGTYHFLNKYLLNPPLEFSNSYLKIPKNLFPQDPVHWR